MGTYYPQTVIYEEKKTTYWALVFVLFFIGMVFFLVYYVPSMGYLIFLPLIGISFAIFATYNMAFYSVKIFDDKTIQFGFPAWNKKLQPSEINSIEEISYHPIWEFGGLGWRIGRGRKNGKWRIGYVVWLQKGIEIEATNGKYYVFGTDNPQEIFSALGLQRKLEIDDNQTEVDDKQAINITNINISDSVINKSIIGKKK